MKWKENLNNYVELKIKKNEIIRGYYRSNKIDIDSIGIHLAVFTEPFLSLLLNGKKTIESRFNINKVSPYKKVAIGDIVFIKKSGGAIFGYFIVKKVQYLTEPSVIELKEVRKMYAEKICASAVNDFWDNRISTKFISLFEVTKLKIILPITINKNDRMAWVVIKQSRQNSLNKELWQI